MLVNRLLTPSVTPLISWNKSVLSSASRLPWPELEAVCWAAKETRHETSAARLRPHPRSSAGTSDLAKVTCSSKCPFRAGKAGI